MLVSLYTWALKLVQRAKPMVWAPGKRGKATHMKIFITYILE